MNKKYEDIWEFILSFILMFLMIIFFIGLRIDFDISRNDVIIIIIIAWILTNSIESIIRIFVRNIRNLKEVSKK